MAEMNYLSETYRRMAVDLDPSEDYFITDSRFMTLDQIFSSLSPGKLCDMGCGRGAILKRQKERHQVYGTEFDPLLVEHCRSTGLNVLQADLNEASSLPFGEVTFDAILISEVLEHLLDPRNALRLARESLRPGGQLILTVPNAVPLFSRTSLFFGRSVDWLHYPSLDTEITGHLRFYTIESMSRLLIEESFKIEEASGLSFRFNGRFWHRFCYWAARIRCGKERSGPARIDRKLGQTFPGLSPGLLFIARS